MFNLAWVSLLVSLIALALALGLPFAICKTSSTTKTSSGTSTKVVAPASSAAPAPKLTPVTATTPTHKATNVPSRGMFMPAGIDPTLARGMMDEAQLLRLAHSNMPGGSALAAGLTRGGMMIDRDMDEGTFSALAAFDTM